MELSKKTKTTRISTILIAAIVIVSLFAAGLLGYLIGCSTISGRISNLQYQL